MFSKQKTWLSGALWKPKNPHSLEHLKYLYNLLCKNQQVTEQNRSLLVETLRSISEILIWGDQNDSSVFDFFLEKNMLSFFLRYLQQRCGRYICVQLLQTLNILFENIRNETSLYYLLSNNHINSIIVHKFDFSDEEVMAYYISFLKTLSLKLNKHTIHFFYNEVSWMQEKRAVAAHTNDFALYTEAIKFFNHSEAMVRIAVRTITLNVFRVDDKAMLRYIRDRTAAPYFSNLVWFIGNHILDLDLCVRHDMDHRSRDRLSDLVAEHLDHLHYLNDILTIGLDTLNLVLIHHLLNNLFIPLYVYSLTKRKKFGDPQDDRKHVSSVVSLFLLSQVFLIMHHGQLVQQLAEVIFHGDITLTQPEGMQNSPKARIREFRAPAEPLEKTLENNRPKRRYGASSSGGQEEGAVGGTEEGNSTFYVGAGELGEGVSSPSTEGALSPSSEVCSGDTELSSPTQNSTDEEKLIGMAHRMAIPAGMPDRLHPFTLENRPYLETLFNALECTENDYSALFALCLLYAMGQNEGISQNLMDGVLMPTERSKSKENYNVLLVERLIRIIEQACQSGSKVRLATLELSIKLLKQLVNKEDRSYLQDRHLACIENARECCTQRLRNFYKSEEIFLDMFEDEYREMKNRPLNVEYLMMDASILLPPTGTPLTGIDFIKRLPCGEVERARKAIRAFFLVRDLSLCLLHEVETQLPLTKEENCIKVNDVLDLNNSDLIACTVVTRESRRQERRFLVIDPVQLILVEPDAKRLGWGVVRFVGFLQDVEVSGDKDDSRLLHVVVHKPSSSVHGRSQPILSARFVFDDHIRCMAAKQRLMKGRQRARQQKMQTIERLLDIVPVEGNHPRGSIPGRSHPVRAASASSSATSSPVTAQPQGQGQGRGARRVTAEQKRHLQAKAAQRSKSRQSQSGGSGGPSSTSPAREGVEVGEEATSAMAVQSLSQNANNSSGSAASRAPGGVSRMPKAGSAGSKLGGQGHEGRLDIPLEDLSTRGKQLRSMSFERARLSRMTREVVGGVGGGGHHGNHGHQGAAHHHPLLARSHSLSPHRTRHETSALLSRKDPRRQSAPIPIPSSPRSRKVAPPPEPETPPVSIPAIRRPYHHSRATPLTVMAQTMRSESSSDDSPDGGRVRSFSNPIPKSLVPSPAPAASLVDGCVGQQTPIAAAMLVPPERTTIVRRSQEEEDEDDDSSRSTLRGQLLSGGGGGGGGGDRGDNLKSTTTTDSALSSDDTGPCSSSDVTPSSETSLSDMSPAPEPASRQAPPMTQENRSATRQLTALAQLVQEHYAYASTNAATSNTTTLDPDGVHAESSQ
ncbi:protein CLEC16A-like isoform X2 [Babylonia areolata]|uniref:protein CLEC16A-like isoform X2 n=1 Tax=Babylonia areolata TaxID=304850 RepID=UPI003FD252BA